MEKIKDLLKNRKIMTGAAAGLAVVVILIIVIAVSCSKNDAAGKNTSKADGNKTTARTEQNTTGEEDTTTEPDTEMSEEETTIVDNEGSTDVAETDTTEQPTTINVEDETTNVNIQEPVTEEPTTEEVTVKITAEVPTTPSQEQEIQKPKPEGTATEKTTECAVLPGCENRESSNIIYLGDEININIDPTSGADVCPFKLYDLNNLATYKYTNGNGYYVTFVGYYGLSCYSDYDGSIMESEYEYATQKVKAYGYNSLEEFETAAEKLKTHTAATSRILVGFYQDIASSFDDGLGGEIDFYGLYIIEN